MLGSGVLRTAAKNHGPTYWNLGDPWKLGLGAYRNGMKVFWGRELRISRNCYWVSEGLGCMEEI